MKTVSIRGVIVPSDYDTSWAASWIERGLITPESAFRRQLDAIADDDVDIRINSPGGSVFAAYEMVNTANDWRTRTGKTLTVTIGALAASAASLFAVMVGRKSIKAHANSKFMFHSASSLAWGGPEAMEDEAAILTKINDEIKAALVTQYDLAPETISDWFREGRMGWLTATEAKAVGMVSEIVDELAEVLKFDSTDITAMGGRGLNIAALLDMEDTEDGRDNSEDAGESGDTAAAEVPNTGDEPGTETVDAEAAYDEGYRAGREDEAKELGISHAAAIGLVTAQVDSLNATITELTETLATARQEAEASREEATTALAIVTAQMDDLKAKHAQLTAGNHAPPLDSGPMTFAEALKHCGGDYAVARKRYPDLYEQQRIRDAQNRSR
jgi:ATP-dependent protease ClpP protease subunit